MKAQWICGKFVTTLATRYTEVRDLIKPTVNASGSAKTSAKDVLKGNGECAPWEHRELECKAFLPIE